MNTLVFFFYSSILFCSEQRKQIATKDAKSQVFFHTYMIFIKREPAFILKISLKVHD